MTDQFPTQQHSDTLLTEQEIPTSAPIGEAPVAQLTSNAEAEAALTLEDQLTDILTQHFADAFNEALGILDTGEVPDSTADVDDEQKKAEAKAKKKAEYLKLRKEGLELLERLAQAYPQAFFVIDAEHKTPVRMVPLAIGIHKKLLPVVQEWGSSRQILNTALNIYTRRLSYQLALAEAPCRIDLDGSEAEAIKDEEREAARKSAESIREWRKKNRPQTFPVRKPRVEGEGSDGNDSREPRHFKRKPRSDGQSFRPRAEKGTMKPQRFQNSRALREEKPNPAGNRPAEGSDLDALMAKFNQH